MPTDPTPELKSQVEREAAELAAAPIVPSAGLTTRCHFCGQLIPGEPELVERIDGFERYRGRCCNGR